jgi:hypothetical protein
MPYADYSHAISNAAAKAGRTIGIGRITARLQRAARYRWANRKAVARRQSEDPTHKFKIACQMALEVSWPVCVLAME